MKILIAPDSFKESLSALQVACEIEAGLKEIWPNATYLKCPVADGGEGTVATMVDALQGRLVHVDVTDPLGKRIQAPFALSGDGNTAVIEMAAASGLALVPSPLRNPMVTTTFGTGELIRAALDNGARHLIIGIGGSATNDGGVGMLQALGVQFKDALGRELAWGGQSLGQLTHIDTRYLDPRLAECRIEVACDVNNPLTGSNGAAFVFGPQKGATPDMVERLDANLWHYAKVIESDTGILVNDQAGAGAAGGCGAALLAFLNATLRPGVEIVMEVTQLAKYAEQADLIITGEGRIDSQTIHGKTPIGVARVGKQFGKPVLGIAGCLSHDAGVVHGHGIDAIFSVIYKACTVEEAIQDAAANVRMAARNIGATMKLGQSL